MLFLFYFSFEDWYLTLIAVNISDFSKAWAGSVIRMMEVFQRIQSVYPN